MIFERCPRCGAVIRSYTLAVLPPIHVKECPSCEWRCEEREEIIEIQIEEKNYTIPC